MLIDFRPHSRLRSTDPVDLAGSLAPVVSALHDGAADLDRVRVVCDWVQYRQSFRDVVDVRSILSEEVRPRDAVPAPVPIGARDDDMEIAVDVRRSGDVELGELVTDALESRHARRLFLEDWGPGRQSIIWDFNALYWSALDLWEASTGTSYEQALPGGESDARNHLGAREIILDLFATWDPLLDRGALPSELFVVEIGVGNGEQAKVFLDEFCGLDRAHGRDYYPRLRYLMCDYSPHVLELARATTVDHDDKVSSFVLDATAPLTALGFLTYKAFLVYISNVYDNLPTDEVAQLGGRTYSVQTRAYVSEPDAAELAASISASVEELPALVGRLLRLGPALLADAAPARFADVDAVVAFWRRVWSALRLTERYVPLAGLDLYQVSPTISGEVLRPLLESGADVRMHVNNGAMSSFADSLLLLHPFGKLICHDIFVTDPQGYRTNFRGPGKYDGSVVNWVNGALMAHIGRRRGFDVHYAPFQHRKGNIVTLTAQPRD